MSYVMKTNIARRENYGEKRQTSDIKYIVLHYTANDGDSDESNAKYFKDRIVKASAHYFVDDDSVTQSVPDDFVAWSVGGSKYSDCDKTGGGKLHRMATNKNTLNIEMCDTKHDGQVMVSETTMANAAALCKVLMKKYGIDSDHVIRHFDVNGKHCPAYFMDKDAWAGFKKRLNSVESKPADKEEVSTTFKPYEVRITISNLNIRKGPGTNYDKIGKFVNPGVYTIIEESNGKGSDKGWGRLKSGIGWISLDFVTKN